MRAERLSVQGHPELYGSGHNVMLKPSVDVLTVKEDLNSAMEVFEELQAHVPFHFVRCGTALSHACVWIPARWTVQMFATPVRVKYSHCSALMERSQVDLAIALLSVSVSREGKWTQVGRAAGAPLQLTPTHFMQWDSMLRKAGGGAAPRKGSTGPPPLRMTALMHESLQLLHSTQPAVAYQRYGVPVEHQNPQQWLAAVKHLPVLQVCERQM